MRQTVLVGQLGTNLDASVPEKRWEKWRPSVAVCQQPDLLIDRYELLAHPRYRSFAERVGEDIRLVSPETEVTIHDLEVEDPWDFESMYGALHAFARRLPFDPRSEDLLVHISTGTHVSQICLFLLTESRHLPARIVQTAPPSRSFGEVSGRYSIIDLDLARYDLIARRFADEQVEALDFLKSGIDTRNESFNELIARIESVAVRSKDPLLLMGPTGAGKSQLARKIYDLKIARGQVGGAFVEVNCATLRGDTAMSALFGHVPGSFTGATTAREGYLRAANGGTLFLDEIGELGLDEQAMLLRAIEERRFFPLGGDSEVESDFQLIAGTNRNLRDRVLAGAFREDLLARINLWTFELPGLVDRKEDIAPNLDFELQRATDRMNQPITMNREARESFLRFAGAASSPWLGNFRDLNAAVTRMATLATGGRIRVDQVAEEIDRLRASWRGAPEDRAGSDAVLRELLDESEVEEIDPFDRVQLAFVLRTCRSSASLSEAGRRLFESSRKRRKSTNDADRLRKYLARFGLDWGKIQESSGAG